MAPKSVKGVLSNDTKGIDDEHELELLLIAIPTTLALSGTHLPSSYEVSPAEADGRNGVF